MRGIALVLVPLLACGRSGFDVIPDVDAPAPVDAREGDAAVATTFVLTSRTVPTTGALSPRRSTGAAIAPDGRVWIYGGYAGTAARNEIAALTPTSGAWVMASPNPAPPTRERHVTGWDPTEGAAGVLVVYGGYEFVFPQGNHFDDLFTFNPATATWTQLSKSGAWPAPRKDAVMFWVDSLGGFLLYGGNDGAAASDRFTDVWLLTITGTTASWSSQAASGDTAPAQSAPCAGFDPIGKRLVVFGGETADGTDADTTYQYLVDQNRWQRDVVSGPAPSPRSFCGAAWDPDIRRLVLHGGQNSTGAPVAGSYIYDADTKRWDTLALAAGATMIGSLSDTGAAFSPALGGVFLFGGRTASTTYTSQSWLLDVIAE